jgi:cytochrome c oxidase subunit II
MAAPLASAAMASPSLFDAHSPEAHAIADLFTETLAVCGVILTVVTGLILWCVVRFRAKGAAMPPQTHGDRRLEIAWTVLPLLVVAWLFFLTTQAAKRTDAGDAREPDLTVVAHQWWWEARYRSGAVTANEIHVPVGVSLYVEIQSADVIHDFWVPQLARKIDATPGHPTHVWMQADAPGTYTGACAEYCGAEHAWMRIAVIAEPPSDFEAWERGVLSPATAPETPEAARGARLFADKTCARCHGILTSGADTRPRVAPDLTHVGGRQTLAAGLLANNLENLTSWLKNPQALKPGSHMPSLQLTGEEARDLALYFEGLR